ncbi:PEP-CTERM sorting domain-containing protein [Haloferula sp. A504]|uniref:PEP-CTERM sorting domain-containing protein n=1 Tax=Haloferula sp. A504 TaxID=3373601 RepID=UPI0037B3FEF0
MRHPPGPAGGLAWDGYEGSNSAIWISAIPEPSTALLGLIGMGLLLRRQRE